MKLALSLYLLTGALHAFEVNGNFKSYPLWLKTKGPLSVQKSWQNSAKVQFTHSLSNDLKAETAYEVTSILKKNRSSLANNYSYRFKDLKSSLHENLDGSHFKNNIYQNLNRLNVSWSNKKMDIMMGRQPIAFGSAKSINPTDVLTPFVLNSIDKEDRTGIDALNFKVPLNETSLIEMAIVAGEDLKKKNNAAYIRPKFNFANFDISLTIMKFKERGLMGLDVTHPIGDAGSWIEIAAVDESATTQKDFVRLTSGLEYKFQNSFYIAGEYHYNGASVHNLKVSPSEFVFLKNYHYGAATMSYELTSLFVAWSQTYINLSDHSVNFGLKLDYNLTENSYLGAGTFLGIGPKLKSEFGKYNNIYFSSFRYYF